MKPAKPLGTHIVALAVVVLLRDVHIKNAPFATCPKKSRHHKPTAPRRPISS